MFHPLDHPLERGWVGRIEAESVIHLAAQTLQSFFSGGGTAREHARYPLAEVRLLAPVLHPPAIRVFDDETSFEFANHAAVVGPEAAIPDGRPLALVPRVAAVLGLEGRIAGFTGFADWRRGPALPPKDRDFALGLGPVVVTPDELSGVPDVVVRTAGADSGLRTFGHGEMQTTRRRFDWEGARAFAADGTILQPGDIIAGPAPGAVDPLEAGTEVEIEFEVIGTLRQTVR